MDQLPTEILLKIFGFLNRFDQISLVSKKFYDLACEVNDANICLKVSSDHFPELVWLPSILNSNRQIKKIEFNQIRPSTIILIVQSFSLSIKCLSISSQTITMSEFLEILSLAPNTEALTIDGLRLRHKHEEWNEILPCDLDLIQLKTLKLEGVCDKLMAVFERLPDGVLTELTLTKTNFDKSAVLLKRQTNIKNLKLFSLSYNFASTSDVMFQNLNLESFTLLNHRKLYAYQFDLRRALSTQTKLKSLLLGSVDVHETFLDFVANQFTELESFSLDDTCYPYTRSSALISKISNLRTMRHMSVAFFANHITPLVKYHNPGITEMTLLGKWDNDPFRLSVPIRVLPNLKVLQVKNPLNSQQLNAIMSNFYYVEVLEICHPEDGTFDEGDCYNTKLKELKIDFSKCYSPIGAMDKFITSCPNVKKLELFGRAITASHFKRILDGFTELEFLKCNGSSGSGCGLTLEDLNYLRDHGKNLKKIHLDRFMLNRLDTLDELKRNLGAIFGVISKDGCNLCMAIDRTTFNKPWCTP